MALWRNRPEQEEQEAFSFSGAYTLGTKYSTQTITGYNTSPPPDDGTQVASNLVTWAGQKQKLADPIKTLTEAINTALVADLNYSSRAVTSTDAVLATDHKKTLQCSGTFTETLLDAATAGAGFHVWIKNNGTGVVTVDRATATDTVDSVSSVVTLCTLESSLFVVNAAANGYLRLVGGSTPDTTPIVHGATDKTKRVRLEVDGLTANATRVVTVPDRDLTIGPTLGTPVVSTSGTSIDFTGIPSGTKRITVMFKGVSTNGTSNKLVQIGDSGGIETSGYLGTSGTTNFTTGFGIEAPNAANVLHGQFILSLENASNFTWVASGVLGLSDAAAIVASGGSKSTSAELDRVRITTVNGTDAFDAGEINISYE